MSCLTIAAQCLPSMPSSAKISRMALAPSTVAKERPLRAFAITSTSSIAGHPSIRPPGVYYIGTSLAAAPPLKFLAHMVTFVSMHTAWTRSPTTRPSTRPGCAMAGIAAAWPRAALLMESRSFAVGRKSAIRVQRTIQACGRQRPGRHLQRPISDLPRFQAGPAQAQVLLRQLWLLPSVPSSGSARPFQTSASAVVVQLVPSHTLARRSAHHCCRKKKSSRNSLP
mmetsp:Transcript_72102/g.207002  ORF Transcript_72102/g.207002 Transcript_72102/m.207002 type:complete len:225 (-) Transcript_72102:1266-1940(-)